MAHPLLTLAIIVLHCCIMADSSGFVSPIVDDDTRALFSDDFSGETLQPLDGEVVAQARFRLHTKLKVVCMFDGQWDLYEIPTPIINICTETNSDFICERDCDSISRSHK